MAEFQIVSLLLDKSVVYMPQYGTFTDGKVAAAQLETIAPMLPNLKLQVRPVPKADDWQDRESQRMLDGTYQPLVWADRVNLWPDHFAHVSPHTPAMVEYTPSIYHGKSDRRKSVPVNRYLRMFHGHISAYERRLIVALHRGNDFDERDVMFAHTSDDIREVYLDDYKVSSCMSYEDSYYAGGINPVIVYGAGDLAIAYMEDDDGHVVARTLVWPDKRIYNRIYDYDNSGDLEATLTKMGYLYDNIGFHGARLLKQEQDGDFNEDYYEGYLCPYLDISWANIRVEDDYLIIAAAGSYETTATGIAVRGGRGPSVYDSIAGKYLAFDEALAAGLVCCISGDGHEVNTMTKLHDGRAVGPEFADSHTFVCPITSERHLKRDGSLTNGGYVSPNYKEQAT